MKTHMLVYTLFVALLGAGFFIVTLAPTTEDGVFKANASYLIPTSRISTITLAALDLPSGSGDIASQPFPGQRTVPGSDVLKGRGFDLRSDPLQGYLDQIKSQPPASFCSSYKGLCPGF